MTTLYRLLTGQDDTDFCHKVSLALSKVGNSMEILSIVMIAKVVKCVVLKQW